MVPSFERMRIISHVVRFGLLHGAMLYACLYLRWQWNARFQCTWDNLSPMTELLLGPRGVAGDHIK